MPTATLPSLPSRLKRPDHLRTFISRPRRVKAQAQVRVASTRQSLLLSLAQALGLTGLARQTPKHDAFHRVLLGPWPSWSWCGHKAQAFGDCKETTGRLRLPKAMRKEKPATNAGIYQQTETILEPKGPLSHMSAADPALTFVNL